MESVRKRIGSILQSLVGLAPAQLRGRLVRTLMRVLPSELSRALARRSYRLLRANDHLLIATGPLRGARWIPTSTVHLTSFDGSYETENQELFREHLRQGGVVYDVGANVGFFTLLAARLVGSSGRVFAFEPFPEAVAYLREHVAINGLDNVTILDAAVGARAGRARFAGGAEHTTGRVSDEGEFAVDVVTLDALHRTEGLPAPDLVKIDIEGAEADALRGAQGLLARARPFLVLATHGTETHGTCCELLESLGYEIEITRAEHGPGDDFRGGVFARPQKQRRASEEALSV